ncbi:hypothetical protein DPMN_085149 [Dreissena polymorpha]|uniref:C1q domain-containing protein n=1 Tax=Dreissena polymorpha TaxID=45954 RepID=A0A9D4BK17_DREPO|nr:hypothetical protein DPMN_085149 [Dreissena polymorpha]
MPPPKPLKRQIPERIAFCAGQSAHHVDNLDVHQTILFDEVFSNVGNAYNPNSGVFRVSVSGYYVMSLVYNAGVKTGGITDRYLEVVSNGVKLGDVIVDSSSSPLASATKVWVFHLQRGTDVWVRTTTFGISPNDVHGHSHTMLTGWLLYDD